MTTVKKINGGGNRKLDEKVETGEFQGSENILYETVALGM